MSSPATQTKNLKIKLNFGSKTARLLARSHSYSNHSLNSSNLNSQPTPPSAVSSTSFKSLLNSPIGKKSELSSKSSSKVSSTPLSNTVSIEGSTNSENSPSLLPSIQITRLDNKPNKIIRSRLLKVSQKVISLNELKSPSQNSISSGSQLSSSSSSRQTLKKLYLPKRKFKGTSRSIVRANNYDTSISSDNMPPPRSSKLKTQPVFGIRGYQAFKSRIGKKSRRKGPQPLFKRVLLKNANFATYERMKLVKDLKPRQWKLERVEKLSDESCDIRVSAWKPTSSRKIRPIILPSTMPISRPNKQQQVISKNIQPHTIPAPTNVNKTVTANRGAIPVLSFMDENGNKRLQCPGKGCPKHFADRCGLNRHKKKHHPELELLGSSSQLNS